MKNSLIRYLKWAARNDKIPVTIVVYGVSTDADGSKQLEWYPTRQPLKEKL